MWFFWLILGILLGIAAFIGVVLLIEPPEEE